MYIIYDAPARLQDLTQKQRITEKESGMRLILRGN